MLDTLHGLLDGFAAAEAQFAGATAALAFLAFLVEFVRGRATARSFRPLIGWATAVLGALAAAAAAHALYSRPSPPGSGGNWLLISTCAVGVLMILTGVLGVVLAPGANRTQLRQIAAAVEASVGQSGYSGSLYVPLGFQRRTGAAWLGESREVSLRKLATSKLPTATVSVVAGPANSGKSVELGHLVVDICDGARKRRRPQEVAIYVSAHRAPAIEDPITVDTIRDHLVASIANENGALGDVFAGTLDSDAAPHWLFVFDLGAELTREQEEQYFEALRNFMLHRDRDRAVVAVRDEFPDAAVVLTPRPLDLRVINKMLERLHVAAKVKPPLEEWRLASAFADPANVTQFGPQLVHADQKSVRDIVESFLTEQLSRHTAIDTSIESLRGRAEEVAFRIVFGAGNNPVSNEEAAPLIAANLVRAEHGAFAFRFPITGVHLAAGYLTRAYEAIPLLTLLRTETTQAVLVTAMYHADQRFVQHIVGQIEQTAKESVRLADNEKSPAVLPPLGSFRWPPVILHALTVLRDLDRLGTVTELSTMGRTVVDHLLWHAVLGGGRHDREVALTLLPLASPERVLDLYRQSVSLGYDNRTTSIIAISVRFDPDQHPIPTIKERLTMVKKALNVWQTEALPLWSVPADGYGLLRPLLDKVIFSISAFYLGGTALIVLSAFGTSGAVVLLIVAIATGAGAWYLRGGGASITPRIGHLPFVMIMFVEGVVVFLPLVLILSGPPLDFAGGVVELALVYYWSWPICMAAAILRYPMRQPTWWFPHRILAELVRDHAAMRRYATELMNHLERLGSPRRWRHALLPIDIVGRQIMEGSMSKDGLLAEFAERANYGYAEFSQLIKVLAAAPPGTLRECVPVLQALDELLEYFQRTLPAPARRSKIRIKPDMWRYAPVSDPARLREWAVGTDRKRPGLLLRLANNDIDRQRLTHAIDNSTTEITSDTSSPPVDLVGEGAVGQI